MNNAVIKAIKIVGGQSALAKICGATQPTVNQWKNGGKMDVRYVAKIIQATNGAVTAQELRPDVEWSAINQQ